MKTLLILHFFVGPMALANIKYSCTQGATSQFSYSIADKKFETKQTNEPKEKKLATFVVGKKKGTFKYDSEQYDLTELVPNAFYFRSSAGGEYSTWHIYPGSKGAPTFILYQTSLDTGGPFGFSSGYICD